MGGAKHLLYLLYHPTNLCILIDHTVVYLLLTTYYPYTLKNRHISFVSYIPITTHDFIHSIYPLYLSTLLIHSTHPLYSSTLLIHSTHPLYSSTLLIHSIRPLCPLPSYCSLIHSSLYENASSIPHVTNAATAATAAITNPLY
jgi:hypothetical protein